MECKAINLAADTPNYARFWFLLPTNNDYKPGDIAFPFVGLVNACKLNVQIKLAKVQVFFDCFFMMLPAIFCTGGPSYAV